MAVKLPTFTPLEDSLWLTLCCRALDNRPAEVPVTRYRCRGTQIPTPWTSTTQAPS